MNAVMEIPPPTQSIDDFGGIVIGKSPSYDKGELKGLSRTIDTNGSNGVVEYVGVAVNPASKKLEFNGYKDTECPTLLATDYKCPKTILERKK